MLDIWPQGTRYEAIPALPEQREQVRGIRSHHKGKQSINMPPVCRSINKKLQAAGSLRSGLLRMLRKMPQNVEG